MSATFWIQFGISNEYRICVIPNVTSLGSVLHTAQHSTALDVSCQTYQHPAAIKSWMLPQQNENLSVNSSHSMATYIRTIRMIIKVAKNEQKKKPQICDEKK